MSEVVRAPRDPEGRRRAIVEAAAALIVEDGANALTHRKVAARAAVPLGATTQYFVTLDELKAAALELLAGSIDEGLRELTGALAAGDDPATVLAQDLHRYLTDPVRVRADTAFYVASSENPALRPVATRWLDGMVDTLSAYTDEATALAVAIFADGAMLHAALHDEPLDEAVLAATFARLLGPGA